MAELRWSESFEMGVPVMDQTHEEFIDLLAQVVQANDAQLMALWTALVEHTESHFAREDRWMKDTGFSANNCHTVHHQMVLRVLRDGKKRGDAGELAVVRQMADELSIWFSQHANTMDAALAQHMQHVGYDETTGQVRLTDALPTSAIEGCHGSNCSPDDGAQAKLETT